MTRRSRLLLLLLAATALVAVAALGRPRLVIERLEQFGFRDAAARAFLFAVEGSPDDDGLLSALHDFMVRRKREDELVAFLERLERRLPESAAVPFWIAQTRAGQGRLEEAVDAYARAIRIGGADEDTARNNRGYELGRLGRYEEAAAELAEAERLSDEPVFPSMNRALMLARAGRLAEALALARENEARFGSVQGSAGPYWAKRAVVEEMAGDREAALASAERMLTRGLYARRWIVQEAAAAELRKDARYKRLVEEARARRRAAAAGKAP